MKHFSHGSEDLSSGSQHSVRKFHGFGAAWGFESEHCPVTNGHPKETRPHLPQPARTHHSFAKIGSYSPYGRQHGWVFCAQDVRGGTTDCGGGCHSTGIVTCVFSIPVLCRYLPWNETFSLKGRLLRPQQILYKAQEGKNNKQITKIKQKTHLSSLCKFLKFTRFTRPFLQVT